MKKNHGVLFGRAVIAIAALALFAGCSNGSTDDDTPTPKVVLAAGSQGTAGDKKITLVAAGKYVVKTGGLWYGIDATDGSLKTAADDVYAAAVTDTEALDANAEITGLTNDTTYDVYLVSGALADGKLVKASGGNDGDFNTGGKNAVINLAGLSVATNKITVSAGAATGGTLVFLTANAIDAVTAAGDVTATTEIECATLDYTVGVANSPVFDGAQLVATVATNQFFILTNVGSEFTAEVAAKATD